MEPVCRVCMSRSVTLVDLFTKQPQSEEGHSLAEMINECVDCEVTQDDPLPNQICLSCALDAQNAFRFKRKCEQSHQRFWEMLDKNKNLNLDESNNVMAIHSEWSIGEYEKEMECIKKEVVGSPGMDSWEDTLIDNLQPKHEVNESLPEALDTCTADSRSLNQIGCKENEKYEQESNIINADAISYSSKKKNLRLACPHCAKVFPQRGNLHAHLLVHSGDRPFICEHCSKAFNHPSNLKKHLRIHLDIRPHKCPYCLKTYTRRQHVDNHINWGNCPRMFKGNRRKAKQAAESLPAQTGYRLRKRENSES